MRKNTKLGLVAAVATAALAFGIATPAYADPSGSKTLSGTGSDTTQDVVSGVASVVGSIGSYDATGSLNITVNGKTFTRPVGSGAGIRALSSSVRGIAYGTDGILPVGTLQFARSSALRSESGTELTYIPFARDAVTVAMSASSDFPKDVALGAAGQPTTTFTLRNIYLGTVKTFVDSDGNSKTIRRLLPQQNSGTRAFWATALGTTEAAMVTAGATDLGNTVIEHDGSFLTTDTDIVPFSVGQYLAQGNHATLPTTVVERRGNVVLGMINSIKPIVYDGTTVATNPEFGVSRLVYNVVETRALTTATPSATDSAIRAAFAGTTSGVCAASAQIKQYGFATIGSQCGNTSAQRGYLD